MIANIFSCSECFVAPFPVPGGKSSSTTYGSGGDVNHSTYSLSLYPHPDLLIERQATEAKLIRVHFGTFSADIGEENSLFSESKVRTCRTGIASGHHPQHVEIACLQEEEVGPP